MKRILTTLALGAAATTLASLPATAQMAPSVELSRLECGTNRPAADVNDRFSDTRQFPGLKLEFVFSCYLIKHGDDYLLWDTGFGANAGATAPKESIAEQLAKRNLKPENVKFVGVSHYHGDHTGQLPLFPGATLLVGKGDWDAITAPKPAEGVNAPA